MLELKKQYTIIIVTHNMQQAARVSDETVFLTMGELSRRLYGGGRRDQRAVHQPEESVDRGLRLGPLWMRTT